jgi:hypothetical protein
VQGLDLAGELLDGADAVLRAPAGMRRLAGHLELEEDGTFAPRDEISRRPARLRIEHRAGVARLILDHRA